VGPPLAASALAVENASGLGHDLTQRLLDAGEQVLDVPAKLSTRVRLLAGGTLARLTQPMLTPSPLPAPLPPPIQ